LLLSDDHRTTRDELPYSDGLAVVANSAGSPASKAKPYPVKSGYTVGYIDGKFIDNVGTYCDVLRSHKSGDVIGLQFGGFDNSGKAALYQTEVTIE
jgi:hypothetical protein